MATHDQKYHIEQEVGDALRNEQQADTFTQPAASPVDPKALSAAIMSAEPDVEMPGRGHAGSVVSNLISLAVGECYTRSQEIKLDGYRTADLQIEMNLVKQSLRQSVNQSVRHAKKYDDRELSMETTETFTSSGRFFMQVIVTRTS